MNRKPTIPRKFCGNRIYVPTNYPGIKKILVWDWKSETYIVPTLGGKYQARKQIKIGGKAKTITKQMADLNACFRFRSTEEAEKISSKFLGPTIKDLFDEYRSSPAWELLNYSTQVMYEGVFERWFDLISDVKIHELTPNRITQWISDMKSNVNRFGNGKLRRSFRKEYDLLKSILTWYGEYKDDPNFVSPIRKRHQEEYWVNNKAYISVDDDFAEQISDEIPLTESEFQRFRSELANAKFGDILVVLADCQYEHSLRVSEVAALHWTDIKPENPEWTRGEIKFQRHVQYIRRKRGEIKDRIVPGLKNKKAVKRQDQRFVRRKGLSKTNPFFPNSTRGLRKLFLQAEDKKGLVFVNPETKTFFTYKCIKDKYDRAFKRAGLKYTGTHIVRYGGVNAFMERYSADEKAAMELLGNESENRYVLRRSRKVHDIVFGKQNA